MTYLTSLIERLSKTIGIGASTTSRPTAAAADVDLPREPVVPAATPETTVASTNGSS